MASYPSLPRKAISHDQSMGLQITFVTHSQEFPISLSSDQAEMHRVRYELLWDDRARRGERRYGGTARTDDRRTFCRTQVSGICLQCVKLIARFEDGSRFAEVPLYHFNSFPMGLIGPAEIMWCPDGNRIWIRVHPSIYTETFGAIKEAVAAESKCLVLIHDLREDLGSFEFVGPQSGRLIRRILRICRTDDKVKKQVSLALSQGWKTDNRFLVIWAIQNASQGV